MTALQLLAYISAALLFQIAAGAVVLVRRKLAPVAPTPQGNEPEGRANFTGAWSGWRDFRVVRRNFEDAAKSQCSFHLQPVDGALLPPFQPGQYLTFSLQVDDDAPGGSGQRRRLTRCYSLSDRPDPAGYRITVKRALPPANQPELPPGASSNYLHDHVREGDVLQVRAPAGRFYIDTDASMPAVFIAGGIGITPMMSMLRWCEVTQPERPMHLFYGVRSSADHAFKQVLEDLARSHASFHLHVVYSSPQANDVLGVDFQHAGYIDRALLGSCLSHGRHQFYVCGPPPMMQSLIPALRDWGVREDDLHFETFGPASLRPATSATDPPTSASPVAIDVRFNRSGRTLVWDGQDANLLDFAERHHVAIDSGCRSGSCGSCETRLVSGVVVYAETPDHVPAEDHCLLCVGKPQSALVLEA
jgi:ferredoxin-NADP reductase